MSGIPFADIDAVENADELVATGSHDPVEPEAPFGRLNLFGVPAADRRDVRRGIDPALEQADLSPVLEPVDRQLIPVQVQSRQPVGFEEALVREVVNREDGRRAAEHGMVRVERPQVDRRQACLPVVRVSDSGRSTCTRGKLERRADEKRKATGVIRVIRVVEAVERVAVVELGTVDEQRAGAVGQRRLVKAR